MTNDTTTTLNELRRIFAHAPFNVFKIDADLVVRDFYGAATQDLAAAPEKFLRRSLEEFMPQEHIPAIRDAIGRCLQERHEVGFEYDLPISGRQEWFKATLVPLSKTEVYAFVSRVTEARQSLDRLRESEANFRTFFETVDDLFVIGTMDGKIVYVNQSFRVKLGYDNLDLERMHILDLHPRPYRQEAEQTFAAMFRGEKDFCPLPIMTKAGVHMPVETRVWLGRWNSQDCMFGIIKDLSKQRAAFEMFHRLFDNNPTSMAVSSLQSRRFIEVNESFLQTLGFERGDVIGKTADELSMFADPGAQEEAVRQLVEQGRIRGVRLKVRKKDGSLVEGLLSGEVVENQGEDRLLTVLVDLTPQVRAAEHLGRKQALQEKTLRLAGMLSRADSSNVDVAVDEVLAEMGRYAGVDRAYLFRIDGRTETMTNTHEWCADGIAPQKEGLREIPLSIFPWWMAKLQRSEFIVIPDVSQMPPEASEEKAILEPQSITSLLAVPAHIGGSLFGFIGFDYVQKPYQEDVADNLYALQVIGELIATTISRVETEAAARQDRDVLANLVKMAEVGVVALDDAGTIGFVNPRMEQMFGYEPGTLTGLDLKALLNVSAAIGDTPGASPLLARRRDGSEFYVEAAMAPLSELGRAQRALYIRDVTERVERESSMLRTTKVLEQRVEERTAELEAAKHALESELAHVRAAEEKIRESEELFRLLYESMIQGVVVRNADGDIISANPAAEKILGARLRELSGPSGADPRWHSVRPDGTALPAEQHPATVALRTGKVVSNVELGYVRPGGHETIWLKVTAIPQYAPGASSPTAAFTTFEDITERRRFEQQLLQLSQAIEQLASAVVITDTQGVVQYANASFCRITGYTREESVGLPPTAWIPGSMSFEERQQLWETVKAGNVWRGEFQSARKDGGPFWESAVIAPFKNSDGTAVNFIAVKDDITQQKESQVHLMRTQRLESIGTLAGGIAHDLNNVLGPILLSLDYLREKVSDESGKRMLAVMEQSAIRGSDLIRQVLSFARGAEGMREIVQVRHIINDIRQIIQQTFPKSIQLDVEVPRDLATVLADPTQIHQVLMNLCVNARDAMPNGGRLRIRAANFSVDEQYAKMVPGATYGEHLLLTVSDTGSGIPAQIRDRIFDPFFTTKEQGKGTGLGLPTVLSIVKALGGFIDLQSEPGTGTRFHIYLPATQGKPVEAGAEAQASAHGRGESILLIDDEESMREITEATLTSNGYRVLTASDGTDAVALYATQKADIQLVVVDMMMPNMDGPSVMRIIRHMNDGVKFIAVSGLNQANFSGQIPSETVFLLKPYNSKTLLNTVRETLDGKRGPS